MAVRLPSRRLVGRLLFAGSIAMLAVTTFLMNGLMGDAAATEAERIAKPRAVETPRLVPRATPSADYFAPGPRHRRQARPLPLIPNGSGSGNF